MIQKYCFLLAGVLLLLLSSVAVQAQWVAQITNTTQNLRSLELLSATDGWATGAGSTLLRTTDAGKTWGSEVTGHPGNYNAIAFGDFAGVNGWIVGDMPFVLTTDNNGITWSTVASSTTSTLNSIQFLSTGNLGWAVGNTGTIIGTTDAGATWNKEVSGVSTNLYAVVFVGTELTSVGWAVGDNGTILVTTDNGGSWVPKVIPYQNNLYAMDMVDPNNGWIVGDQIILHTIDGGVTWLKQDFVNPTVLRSIAILDTATAYAAGIGGRMLKTTDGKTWVDQSTGTANAIYALQFQISPTIGWAAGDNGMIITFGGSSAVAGKPSQPMTSNLMQNFPNPFNPSTTISYYLTEPSHVSLKIYDQLGRLVSQLLECEESAGEHAVVWRSQSSTGDELLSGVYTCRLEAGAHSFTRKMVLSK